MKEIITDIDKLNEIGICDVIDTRKENELLRERIVNLKEVVRSQNLSILSAPQLGYDKRVFVINYNGDIRTYVNPMIVNVKGLELSRETCPSLPGKEYIQPTNVPLRSLGQVQDIFCIRKAQDLFCSVFRKSDLS